MAVFITEYIMLDHEWDHIISLGGHCQTAYQIRRYFGEKRAFPLDWWVTPTVSLVDLFESGFADIFLPQNMKIVHEDSGPAVMCTRYGVMHYHDFDEAKINGAYSPYLVRTKCAENDKKYTYLIKRLLNLTGDILFIRFAHGWVQYHEQTMMFNAELLTRLMNAMRPMMPRARVFLLLLNDYNHIKGMDGNPLPGVYTSLIDSRGATQWYGSNEGWEEMFRYHNIRLRKPEQSEPAAGATQIASA